MITDTSSGRYLRRLLWEKQQPKIHFIRFNSKRVKLVEVLPTESVAN